MSSAKPSSQVGIARFVSHHIPHGASHIDATQSTESAASTPYSAPSEARGQRVSGQRRSGKISAKCSSEAFDRKLAT